MITTIGLSARPLALLQRAGDQFLARAALALDQDRLVGRTGALDHAKHLLHGRRLADDLDGPLAAIQHGLKLLVLLAKLPPLVGLLDQDFQLRQRKRLGQIVVRA